MTTAPQARAAGDPDLLAVARRRRLSPSTSTRRSRPSACTRTSSSRRASRRAGCARRAWEALETFWTDLQALLPGADRSRRPRARLQQSGASASADSGASRSRPAATMPRLVELLEIWESKPGVTQKWWAPKANGAKAGRAAPRRVPRRRRAAVPHRVAPVTSTRRSVTLLTTRARRGKAERRRRNALSFNDLLLSPPTSCGANPVVRRALQQKYRWLFVDEFQDTDPVQAEIMFLLARMTVVGDMPVRPIGAPSPFVPARCSSSAIRSSRSIASAAPTSTSTTRCATGSAARTSRGVVRLTTNFRSVPGLCDWANRRFRARIPGRADAALAAFAPLRRDPDEAGGGPDARRSDDSRHDRLGDVRLRRRRHRALHPRRGGRRAPQVRRLPDPHAQEEEAASVCARRSRRCGCRSR